MAKRTIEDLKLELEDLKLEELELQFIKNFSCQTEEEFEIFKKENLLSFNRLKFIRGKISEIKWQLMSDKERKLHLKYLEDLKNKFTDESPYGSDCAVNE